ncbi:SsgA family sporulation/cell division regulator, partial [Streptomyces sp. NPDC058955]
LVHARRVILRALPPPDGAAPRAAPAALVAAWLERTLRAVPPGTESERLGIDDGLAELLATTVVGDDLWLRDPWPSDESQDGEL